MFDSASLDSFMVAAILHIKAGDLFAGPQAPATPTPPTPTPTKLCIVEMTYVPSSPLGRQSQS